MIRRVSARTRARAFVCVPIKGCRRTPVRLRTRAHVQARRRVACWRAYACVWPRSTARRPPARAHTRRAIVFLSSSQQRRLQEQARLRAIILDGD